jgi:hypothetical protein
VMGTGLWVLLEAGAVSLLADDGWIFPVCDPPGGIWWL